MLLPLQSLDDVGENLMGLLSQAQGRSPRHAALTGLGQNTETFSPAALIRVKKKCFLLSPLRFKLSATFIYNFANTQMSFLN
jgi:hypothetical protein